MLLPQTHYSCIKSYLVFTKPQANVTFFTLRPGNNFGPKKSLLSSRDLFSSRGKMNEPFSLKMPSLVRTFFFTRGIILVVLLCSVFCLGSWWDYPKLFPTSHFSEWNTSSAVQRHIWEAKHQAWSGKGDVCGRTYQGELMVRLGMMLLLFQEVWSDCGLKMKFLMPVSLPVCLLDQALLWDWSCWSQWEAVAPLPRLNQIKTKEAIKNLEPKPVFQGRKQMRLWGRQRCLWLALTVLQLLWYPLCHLSFRGSGFLAVLSTFCFGDHFSVQQRSGFLSVCSCSPAWNQLSQVKIQFLLFTSCLPQASFCECQNRILPLTLILRVSERSGSR